VTDPGLALAIKGEREVPWHEVQALLPLFWQQVCTRVEPRHRAGRLKQWLNYLRHRYPQAQNAFDAIRVGNDPVAIEAWLSHLSADTA
jgi:tRNA-dihydrouridine synthase C